MGCGDKNWEFYASSGDSSGLADHSVGVVEMTVAPVECGHWLLCSGSRVADRTNSPVYPMCTNKEQHAKPGYIMSPTGLEPEFGF